MRWLRSISNRLRNLFRKDVVERETDVALNSSKKSVARLVALTASNRSWPMCVMVSARSERVPASRSSAC